MLGEGLWSHGTLTLRGFEAPYYSLLTPALIGAPLALLDLADGIQWARLVQALAMSLVAVPTFVWTRRFASPWWAVAAAALVLASPVLHYAGFLMTEPLTLTVVTVALLMLARALEEPSMWRYGVFVAWDDRRRGRPPAGARAPAGVPPRGRDRLASRHAIARACGRSSGSVRSPGSSSSSSSSSLATGGELRHAGSSAPTRPSARRRARRRASRRGRLARVRRRRARSRRSPLLTPAALAVRCSPVATRTRGCARSCRPRSATRGSSSSRSGSSPPSSSARSPSGTC